MMPTPATTATTAAVQQPNGTQFDAARAASVPGPDAAPQQPEPTSRRSSSDGGGERTPSPRHASGSEDDDLLSMEEDDYSSSGSGDEDSDDDASSEDEESLAARFARTGAKRSASSDQSHPAKRRRSSSDSGGGGGDGSSSRKRRNLFPAIRRSQRCGKCHTCLNPQLKKACMTVRERMMKEMQGPSSSSTGSTKRSAAARQPAAAAAAAAAAGGSSSSGSGHQQQQQPLSPAGSADLDQDKYVDILAPLIDRSGGLVDAGSVGPFIQAMGSFKTTLSRVLPTSVLALSRPSLLSDFMSAGGVDLLASWMLEAEGDDGEHAKALLVDVLKLLQKLPVTRAFVSSTRSARVIGSLRKHRDPEVAALAQTVVKQWMKVIPGKAGTTAAKPGSSSAKPAGGSSAAAAGGSSLQSAAAKKTTAQGGSSAAGRAAGSQVQMVSDNDLFKSAAPAKPKASLRTGLGQPKRTGGVQLVDAAEAGKLLTGTAATSRPAAAGTRLLPSQRPRLPSPPLAASASAAAGPRVVVELKVTPEQTVAVTLRVVQAPAGRLPGLRRTGFGSSLGPRGSLGGGAVPGAAHAGVGAEAAPAPAPQPVVRKPRKRVSWRSERELESVRWFVKEDPAVKAREDAFLTEEQLRALAAQRHGHHQDFSSLIMMEHQAEKSALEAHHREEEERRRAAVHAMQPGCPWHGVPPALLLDPEWQVALGEDSSEAQRQRPLPEVLHAMHATPYQQPTESRELQQPPPSSFNVAHHDPNMKLIPLLGAQQQQQQPVQPVQQQPVQVQPVGQPIVLQQPQFGGQPVVLQVPAPQAVQQQQPVTYTLGQGGQSAPQLIVQPIQQPQQQQQQPPPAQGVAGGPPSSSDNSQLLQVLQSLSQSGLLSQQQPQQQQPQQHQQPLPPQQLPASQPVASQVQQPQALPPQQMLQPAPPGLVPPAGAPPGQIVMLNGMPVLLPPGVTPLAAPPSMGAPAGLQLPPGFQLAPPHQQPPPGHPPVVVYGGGPPGVPLPGQGPPGFRPEDHGDFGPGPGPWGGPHGPPPPHEYGPPPGGPYGGRGGEGVGGPQRHGRGGGRGGGPYHREHGVGRGGPAPWQGNARVCKFFNSARGCSKGDTCDFRHLNPGSDLDVREQ